MSEGKSSNAKFVESMEHMFSTDGWRQFMKPRLQELRQFYIEDIFNSAARLEDFIGAREGRKVIDAILAMEDQLAEHKRMVKEDPETAADVVQFPEAEVLP